MMIYLLIIILITASTSYPVKADSISEIDYIRLTFYEAVENEEKLIELQNYIITAFSDDLQSYSPLILAYYGGVTALKAKHAFNPFSKLNFLITSLNYLESAVNKSPDNLEIRFMRFSILHYIPGIIGYGSERDNDKLKIYSLLIKKDYSSLDYDIQKGIIEFMLNSERLSTSQNSELEKLIN